MDIPYTYYTPGKMFSNQVRVRNTYTLNVFIDNYFALLATPS